MTQISAARRRRGQPLATLAVLMAGWIGARMMLWESPFESAFPPAAAGWPTLVQADLAPRAVGLPSADALAALVPRLALAHPHPVYRPARTMGGSSPKTTPTTLDLRYLSSEPQERQAPMDRTTSRDTAPAFLVQPAIVRPAPSERRWHVDGWVAWRSGSGLPVVASGARPPSYGATQAGAVARFDLVTGPHRPALHVRATYAPDRPRQFDLAAGAGVRPLAALPVRVMGELRATHAEGRTEFRPAVLAVTELAPIALPLAMTAEGYAQAGWVGGRYATAFADGQARVTRAVATVGPARVRIGAGAWGGAQKFAERLDAGPTVALDFDAGPLAARLSLDYRVQVAGNATPGDGLALTLSTGF